MERVFLSRQPIYRSDMSVLGYELLFRDNEEDRASFTDGARATTQVIVNTMMEIGMDEMVGRRLAFINFERTLLLGTCCESLPHERSILEILETVEPDQALIKRLHQLRAKGYRIALDDFVCAAPFSPLLDVADYVKVDLLATDWKEIEETVSRLRKYPVELIAEKVETREQFQRCKELGFDYFQGYFFCRPQNMSSRKLPVNRLAAVQLLTKLNDPDIKIPELEMAIGQNVSLSYKLLRYINSALCGLDRQVESIRHATVLLGLEKIRIWASLIVFSGFEDTPREVIVTGAVRARMSELLAADLRLPRPERYFLVGLFSVLDAILDRPLENALSSLSLSNDVAEALLHHKGELGAVLSCVKAFERHDWTNATTLLRLTDETIRKAYVEATKWSLHTLNGLVERPTAELTA